MTQTQPIDMSQSLWKTVLNEGLMQTEQRFNSQQKELRLTPSELLRRYALHVLPKGFMRVRYYGFLANAVRATKLNEIRHALKVVVVPSTDDNKPQQGTPSCPDCGQHHWHYVGVYQRHHWQPG